MKFIIENWQNIMLMVTFVVFVVMFAANMIIEWKNMSKAKREATVREWLLQAVIVAEKEYGGKTGALKLSSVWAKFCATMPWIAQLMSFDRFSELVDETLVKMKKMLESNEAVVAIVEEKKEDK